MVTAADLPAVKMVLLVMFFPIHWENIHVVKSAGHRLVAGHELGLVCKPN